MREIFEVSAALAGKLNPNAHIITAVIVYGYAAEVQAVKIAACALSFRPSAMSKAESFYELLGSVFFGCER